MTAELKARNRWGDPHLLVRGRLSLPAASAFAISLVVVASAAATLGLAGALAGEWRIPAAAIMLLLTLFLFAAAPVVLVLAYVGLCTCRIGTPTRGRGMAWAALGLCWVALVCRLALAATQVRLANAALLALLVFGAMHVLMFAAESRFAKAMVMTAAIASVFLSMLGPWLVYSREHARRLQCGDRLRQLGLQINESYNAGHMGQTASLMTTTSDQPFDRSYMRSLFEFIEPASNVYTLPAENEGNTLWRAPSEQAENEQRLNTPGIPP
jgi:hypothetical protein